MAGGAIRDQDDVFSNGMGGEIAELEATRGFGGEEVEDLRFCEDAAGGAVLDEIVSEERGDSGLIAAQGGVEELLFERAEFGGEGGVGHHS